MDIKKIQEKIQVINFNYCYVFEYMKKIEAQCRDISNIINREYGVFLVNDPVLSAIRNGVVKRYDPILDPFFQDDLPKIVSIEFTINQIDSIVLSISDILKRMRRLQFYLESYIKLELSSPNLLNLYLSLKEDMDFTYLTFVDYKVMMINLKNSFIYDRINKKEW